MSFPGAQISTLFPAFEKEINWNNFPIHLKRGSCCVKTPNGWHIDKEIPMFRGEYRAYIDDLIYIEGDKK